jgi:hypothetical protein
MRASFPQITACRLVGGGGLESKSRLIGADTPRGRGRRRGVPAQKFIEQSCQQRLHEVRPRYKVPAAISGLVDAVRLSVIDPGLVEIYSHRFFSSAPQIRRRAGPMPRSDH